MDTNRGTSCRDASQRYSSFVAGIAHISSYGIALETVAVRTTPLRSRSSGWWTPVPVQSLPAASATPTAPYAAPVGTSATVTPAALPTPPAPASAPPSGSVPGEPSTLSSVTREIDCVDPDGSRLRVVATSWRSATPLLCQRTQILLPRL